MDNREDEPNFIKTFVVV